MVLGWNGNATLSWWRGLAWRFEVLCVVGRWGTGAVSRAMSPDQASSLFELDSTQAARRVRCHDWLQLMLWVSLPMKSTRPSSAGRRPRFWFWMRPRLHLGRVSAAGGRGGAAVAQGTSALWRSAAGGDGLPGRVQEWSGVEWRTKRSVTSSS